MRRSFTICEMIPSSGHLSNYVLWLSNISRLSQANLRCFRSRIRLRISVCWLVWLFVFLKGKSKTVLVHLVISHEGHAVSCNRIIDCLFNRWCRLRTKNISKVLITLLWPSDAIRRHRSGSTFLTAPSHYLNQFWHLISEVLWHSPESLSTACHRVTFSMVGFKIYFIHYCHIFHGSMK